jgi:ATP-dependent DNA helicase RecG
MPVSDAELLADLRRAAGDLGKKTVGQKEYRNVGRYDDSTVTRRFGSWNTALDRAGLENANRDRFNQTASLDDLSLRLIHEFLREVGSELATAAGMLSTEALGRQMNIVGGPREAVFPKNVGVLFF